MSAVTEQSQPEALGGEVARAAAPEGRVVSGQGWAGKYQIGERVGGSAGTWYRAVELAGGREVLVRTWPLAGGVDGRQKIFEQVRALEGPQIQRPIEEQVTEWELVQVWEGLAGVSLRAWRAGHGVPEAGLIVELVKQVGAVVEALQQGGVGHFGLDPDWVYLQETPEGPRFTVGGVDRAEAVERGELIAIEADPLLAPPETAGLYKHSPGTGLLAWDWWSLGRLVQQFFAGRHAVELLPDAVKAQLPRGLRGQAEALLFERTTGAVRAGAVECMTGVDKRLDRLLRGLLTSSAEGRWGAGEVRAWLAGEMPRERYDASRGARYFHVDGRSCTADEAADRLLGPEHCERVVEHAMVPTLPWTFAKFLSDSDEHREQWKQLKAVTEVENASALGKLMPKLRKLIAATLGLYVLAGRTFRWRGRVLTAEVLKESLGRPKEYAALRAELIALADPIVTSQIRRHDHAAAELLETLVKRALEAETFLAKQVGVAPAALGDPARLWQLALESEATLETARAGLKTRYAETSNVAVEKLLATPHPTPTMLLVLARVADDAPRFGFLTHEEVRRRRLAELREQERKLGEVVFWRRLGAAMKAGPMVFGRRWLFAAAITGGVLLLAVHAPGPMGLLLGLGPAVIAIVLRLLANRHQAGVIAGQIKDVAPWGWRDGAARCDREAAKRAGDSGVPAALARATAELTRVQEEIRSVAVAADAVPPASSPRHPVTWAAVVAGWVLAGLLVAGSVRQGLRKPPSWAAHTMAWHEAFTRPHEPTAEELRKSLMMSWPYRPSLTEAPTEMKIEGEFHPTGEQLRYALARGKQLVAAYNPDTINALVAVYVPLENGHGALMFFDGKKGLIQGNNGVLIAYIPLARSWLQIGNMRALFIEG